MECANPRPHQENPIRSPSATLLVDVRPNCEDSALGLPPAVLAFRVPPPSTLVYAGAVANFLWSSWMAESASLMKDSNWDVVG